jgi:hypothetical protein
MNITLNPFGEWRQMATVEVSTTVKDLPALVQDGVLKFQLVPSEISPFRRHCFDLLVNSSEGERRCARTAWAVLKAMEAASAAGCIDHYRIVEGAHWLTLDRAAPTQTMDASLGSLA